MTRCLAPALFVAALAVLVYWLVTWLAIAALWLTALVVAGG